MTDKVRKPCTVLESSRAIFEEKLLASLSDESKVAMILDRADLDLLIMGLDTLTPERARELSGDMQQLRRAAFGE